ncbi:MAG: SsrA-binding protein SmpB [Bacteroidia bacterium]|nr:SsrA-binding protein SmpB [Bacteroidia bacterium]MCX7652111.1 SsrA-binding protein SmpB [Bacteroidia bacterium]MDW8417501.1 SsrA-binding protein SmpB [Bacteroidia bacterium]
MHTPTLTNRKALHDYELLERYTAGIVLLGPEVKSLRAGGGQLQDAFCAFKEGELYLLNMYIAPYKQAGYAYVPERRPRKLLLHRQELKRLQGRLTQKGLTLIPTKLFFNERGWAKVEIALAQGRKKYDKRLAIQAKEERRRIERLQKRY